MKLYRVALTGLGMAALTLFAGCANGPSWGAWSKRPSDAQVAAVLARTAQPQAVAQQAEALPPSARYAATNR